MTYEDLLNEHPDVNVIDYSFTSDKIKGLYCDGTVALNNNIETSAEKACVLAEEIGHHKTSSGIIIEMDDANNRKQEHIARVWGYNRMIGLLGIIDAFEHHCQNVYEVAEFLNVTEQFLTDTINSYRNKYGSCVQCGDYIITFNPTGVMKIF